MASIRDRVWWMAVALGILAAVSAVGCDSVPIDDRDRDAARAAARERVESLEAARDEAAADPEVSPAVRAEIADRLAEAERQRRQVEESLERIARAESEGKAAGGAIDAVTRLTPLPAWLASVVSLLGGAGAVWLRVSRDVRGFRQLVESIDAAKADDATLRSALSASKHRLRAGLDLDVAKRIDALRVTT